MDWQKRHKVVPAVYLIIRKDGRLLMMRRYRTGYCDGMYSLPAGHLDGGESAVSALMREAKEEADLDVAPEDLHLVHTMHRLAQEADYERIDLYFEATKWHGQPKIMETDKCDDLQWFDLGHLPKNITPEVGHALKCLAAGEPYSDYGF
ncbi:MAG TPA: NUDIX domain-containing protein [Patescibacteria group bacterium]|nr:NUDIX domain-containing protein [Patescibacteria group bacterium]